MTAQHPDFQAEVERLAYTKNYMQQILNESQRGLQSAQENIRKSMADLDYLDSSLGSIRHFKFLPSLQWFFPSLRRFHPSLQ